MNEEVLLLLAEELAVRHQWQEAWCAEAEEQAEQLELAA